MIEVGKAASRYEEMLPDRQPAEDRAVLAASVTIPHIMPPDGHSESSEFKEPYQGLGARAVNTLASKIMLALFPPNTPFFRLGFDALTQAAFEEEGDETLSDAKRKLALYEQTAASLLENTSLRSIASLLGRHLLVTGNGVIRLSKERRFKFFDLRKYVVTRDADGNVLLLIVKETVDARTLDEQIQQATLEEQQLTELKNGEEVEVDIYTVMVREGQKFRVWQEINDNVVPDSQGNYDVDAPPFIVLRWITVTNEDYGRGQVSEYYGDFKALDDMSRDLLDASSAAAKILFMLDPNSTTSKKVLAESKSGDIVYGRRDDVDTLSIDKLHDFQVVLERMQDIKAEVMEAFLMNKSVQRDAERVTAVEIRYMAQDLEDALGGVYSLLAQELQAPLIRRWVKVLSDAGMLPKLPKDQIQLTITTGLDALGRGHDIQRLEGMLGQAARILGEERLASSINEDALLNRLAAGWGVPDTDFILNEQAREQRANTEATRRAAEQAAPGVVQETIRQGAS